MMNAQVIKLHKLSFLVVRRMSQKNPELKIVFDTSALYTKASNKIFNVDSKRLINEHSHHTELDVSWFLPEIVRMEREHQMQNVAFDLLPGLEKLERFLDHNLAITKDILVSRVKESIDISLGELGVNLLELVVPT